MEIDIKEVFHDFAKFMTSNPGLVGWLNPDSEEAMNDRLLWMANSAERISSVSLEFEAFLTLVFSREPWVVWVRMHNALGIKNISYDKVEGNSSGQILTLARIGDTKEFTAHPFNVTAKLCQDHGLLLGVRHSKETEITLQMLATFLREWVRIYLWFCGWLTNGVYVFEGKDHDQFETWIELIAVFTLWRNRQGEYLLVRELMEKSENKSGAENRGIYLMETYFQNWRMLLAQHPLHSLIALIR